MNCWSSLGRATVRLASSGVLASFASALWDERWDSGAHRDVFWLAPHLAVMAGVAVATAAVLSAVHKRRIRRRMAFSALACRRGRYLPLRGVGIATSCQFRDSPRTARSIYCSRRQ